MVYEAMRSMVVLVGFKTRKSKEYLLLSWLNFEPWEVSGAQQVLKFISQMTKAPRGSFLADLLAELKLELNRNLKTHKSWLIGALRLISRGLCIPREGDLRARVARMLERIHNFDINFPLEVMLRRS